MFTLGNAVVLYYVLGKMVVHENGVGVKGEDGQSSVIQCHVLCVCTYVCIQYLQLVTFLG